MKLKGLFQICAIGLLITGSNRLAAQQLKLGLDPTAVTQSALLELNSNSQGLLLNRVSKATVSTGGALANAPDGMLVFINDATEKSLYVKKNGAWKKMVDLGNLNIGTGLSVDASGNITNTGVLSFNGRTGAITPILADYSAFYTPLTRNITLATGNAAMNISSGAQDLSADRSWTLTVNNTTALWNANQLNGSPIGTITSPNEGDLLTMVSGKWTAKAPAAAGNAYILNYTTGAAQNANINISGTASFGGSTTIGGLLTASSLTTSAMTATSITTGSLTATNAVNAQTVTTSGAVTGASIVANNLTVGSVPFVGTGKVLSENNGKLFWNTTNNMLGIGNNAPGNTLEVSQTTANNNTAVSGIRLSGIAAATPVAATNKVLSINSTGDVVVQDNATLLNWSQKGNSFLTTDTVTYFLGTTSAKDMVVKYNNKELFRGTAGVGTGWTGYAVTLFNGAKAYNAHPFIIRANGPDVMAFQDSTGAMKFHWNLLGGGLNFVESNVKDNRIFIKSGFGVGIGTNTPAATLDVNGSLAVAISNSTATAVTVADTDHTVLFTANNTTNVNNYTVVTIPDPSAANAGRMLVIKSTTAYSFKVKTTTGKAFESTAAITTLVIDAISKKYMNAGNGNTTTQNRGGSVTLQSDGTTWWILD